MYMHGCGAHQHIERIGSHSTASCSPNSPSSAKPLTALRWQSAVLDQRTRMCRAAEPVLQLLLSAAANAKHNYGMRKSRLIVSTCYAGDGPTLKRIRPRAQGRAFKIRKRTAHVTVKVRELAEGEKPRVKRHGLCPQRKGVRQTS